MSPVIFTEEMAGDEKAAEVARIPVEDMAAEERWIAAEVKAAEEARIAVGKEDAEDDRIADERRSAQEGRIVADKRATEAKATTAETQSDSLGCAVTSRTSLGDDVAKKTLKDRLALRKAARAAEEQERQAFEKAKVSIDAISLAVLSPFFSLGCHAVVR